MVRQFQERAPFKTSALYLLAAPVHKRDTVEAPAGFVITRCGTRVARGLVAGKMKMRGGVVGNLSSAEHGRQYHGIKQRPHLATSNARKV